jgi:hypothetical protein
MSKKPLPKEGCFQATHPSTEWKEVACQTPPAVPMTPAQGAAKAGPSPSIVGNGVDNTAEVAGIFWSEGSFPSATGLTTEADNGNNNDFALQMNTNKFSTAQCLGRKGCKGWEQFLYAPSSWPVPGGVYIQYWLLGFGSSSPSGSGWNNQSGTTNWYKNSDHEVGVESLAITDLGHLVLTGSAGSTDMVTMWTGDGNVYATSQPSVLGLTGNWNVSEFNVFGNGNGTEAVFQGDVTLVVQTLTESAGPGSGVPTCDGPGFTAEFTNLNLVPGCCLIGGVAPGIQFTESTSGKTAAPCPPVALAVPGASLAASQQFGVEQTDVFTVGPNGVLNVSWVDNTEPWNEAFPIGGPVFPAGAPVAASQQFGLPDQTDVFAVDTKGSLEVAWVAGPGAWGGPQAVVPGQFTPGAQLAASRQFGLDRTDVFIVDANGAMTVSWVVDGGVWQSEEISAPHLFPPGASVAASQRIGVSAQTDVFVVDETGTLDVMSVVGDGAWQGPMAISAAKQYPAGAPLAASQQLGVEQTDVFVVDYEGELEVAWIEGAGKWQGPVGITLPSTFAVRGALAATQQFGLTQTDVLAVDPAGNLTVTAAVGGGKWAAPIELTKGGLFEAGAPVAASLQFGTPAQTDAVVVDARGDRSLSWVVESQPWQGPLAIP